MAIVAIFSSSKIRISNPTEVIQIKSHLSIHLSDHLIEKNRIIFFKR